MKRLENWYVNHADCVVGQVYGDPRFPDGSVVITSRVVDLNEETGEVHTKHSLYKLGERRKDAGTD